MVLSVSYLSSRASIASHTGSRSHIGSVFDQSTLSHSGAQSLAVSPRAVSCVDSSRSTWGRPGASGSVLFCSVLFCFVLFFAAPKNSPNSQACRAESPDLWGCGRSFGWQDGSNCSTEHQLVSEVLSKAPTATCSQPRWHVLRYISRRMMLL